MATLERLAARARVAPGRASDMRLSPELLADLGWNAGQADHILSALGYFRADRGEAPEAALWRRRRSAAAPQAAGAAAQAPPAAPLASTGPPIRRKRVRRRRRPPLSGAARA